MYYLHKYNIIDRLTRRILRAWIIYAIIFFAVFIGLRLATFKFNYNIIPKFYVLIPLGISVSLSLVLFNYLLIYLLKRNIESILRFRLNLIVIIPVFFLLNLIFCFGLYFLSGEIFSYFHPLYLRNFQNDCEDLIVMAIISTTLLLSDLILRYNEIIKQQEKLIVKTRFQLLKSRLNPHFLFNNLNTGISLISHSPDKAEVFFTCLAQLYRGLMEGLEVDVRSLEEEISEIKNYLKLMGVKYGDVYRFEVDFNPDANNLKLVSGSLSLIFENIFKHNRFSRKHPIDILLRHNGDYIEIINDYRPKDADLKSFKIGHDYICRQYMEKSGLEPEFILIEDRFISRLPLLKI